MVGAEAVQVDPDNCARTSGKCSLLSFERVSENMFLGRTHRGKMIILNYYKKNPSSVQMGVVDAIDHSQRDITLSFSAVGENDCQGDRIPKAVVGAEACSSGPRQLRKDFR